MKQKTPWQRFSSLPPEAQQQVIDFIVFLQMRYTLPRPRKTARSSKLTKEAFIGMWRNREDLRDSTAWVRKSREREWGKP
jgi:hypothetical protein